MRSKITRIGNSLGIIIPSKILKEMSLKEKDEVSLELHGPRLVIGSVQDIEDPFAPISRGGWYDDPRETREIIDEIYSMRHSELERGIVDL
ncbi:MAG: AbrB/MazE/SpoVT family DNA-binding domain-containing protein [Bacteroidales bacterium]|nr:AbrB/MazE/SpoVT family DNA-binding domain-containing protein [Bacteroidales bacterium]